MIISIRCTDYRDKDFQDLVASLDKELWKRYREKEAEYEKFNQTIGINHVIILMVDLKPAGCGCFKKFDESSIEVKRMFVKDEFRNKGLGGRIVGELESWAASLGYSYAVLETAIRQPEAIHLYKKLGYVEIEKYGPYINMDESICMRKPISTPTPSSVFKGVYGIEYFDFEEDFVEADIRCIPMIVRFKMDAAGIKLRLSEWSRFSNEERIRLAISPCSNEQETAGYREYLIALVRQYSGGEATALEINHHPDWSELNRVPEQLVTKAGEFNWSISLQQWKNLTELQRFALLKLCRPGHENRNFPKAMQEFGLTGIGHK